MLISIALNTGFCWMLGVSTTIVLSFLLSGLMAVLDPLCRGRFNELRGRVSQIEEWLGGKKI